MSTGRAMLLSALLPGGGQFYTGQVLKGIGIGVTEVSLAGLTVREHLLYQTERTTYRRDRRNAFLWWTGFVVGFSVADAYVSACMFGFREEQRLDAIILPNGLELALAF